MDTLTAAHTLTIRVYYEDTDAGGIVYYANYMKYFERARTEWLRTLGLEQRRLAHEQKLLFVVKKCQIDYVKPARLDDLIQISSQISRLGAASIVFAQQAQGQEQVLCRSQTVVACVDSNTLRPTKLDPMIRAILEKVTV